MATTEEEDVPEEKVTVADMVGNLWETAKDEAAMARRNVTQVAVGTQVSGGVFFTRGFITGSLITAVLLLLFR